MLRLKCEGALGAGVYGTRLNRPRGPLISGTYEIFAM